MVSHVAMNTNGWKLVNITPMNLFFKGLNSLKRNILIISLISILAGLVVTVIFSSQIYTPLRLLIDKVKDGARRESNDEYVLINNALENLTLKVDSLEHTLDENKPRLNLIGLFENFASREVRFLATEISESEIALIQNSIHDTPDIHRDALRSILESIFTDPDPMPTVYTGGVTPSPLAVHNSFNEITSVQKYAYFLPEKRFYLA